MKRILLVSCLVPHGIAIQCGPAAVLCTAVVAIKNIRHLGISLSSHFVSSNYEGTDYRLGIIFSRCNSKIQIQY